MRLQVLAFTLCLSVVTAAAICGLWVGRWTMEVGPAVVVGPLTGLGAGQPTDRDDLAAVHLAPSRPPTAELPWTVVVPSGLRLASIPVAEGPALRRMVARGSVVDVLGLVDGAGTTGTVLSDVGVFGITLVGRDTVLTVLVTSSGADRLDAASARGALRISVRDDVAGAAPAGGW